MRGSTSGWADRSGRPWSRGARIVVAVVPLVLLALGTLVATSIDEIEDAPSTGAVPTSSSTAWESTPLDGFSLSDIEGGTWGDAWSAMVDSLDDGEVRVLDGATGLPLKFAYGDPQRDEWTVCAADLTSGSINEPGRLVTVEIADPHDGCSADSQTPEATQSDEYGAETDVPTSAAEDDTADGTSDGEYSGSKRRGGAPRLLVR
ncbi:hypothetical protein ACFXKS_36635 [Streptomyces scopuliridis]|uniref:hypothetical protein n=1 Tax=Streptomyces scopuliridis TaxID=452529 RepID=UPI0036B25914